MSSFRVFALSLCLAMAGCRPNSVGQGDEQKDPYFLAGKNRLQERDYQKAIEMFEKALDVNPRSASAHFELGVLYEQQQGDYPAALYHYERAVMLNSNASFAELSRQRMQECKRELAKSIVQPISMDHLQRELNSARADNQQLRQQLSDLQNSRGGTVTNGVPSSSNSPSRTPQQIAARSDSPTQAVTAGNTGTTTRLRPTAASSRVHVIASGETLAQIARRYSVKLSALQAANPGIDARRLRVGQTLTIPEP